MTSIRPLPSIATPSTAPTETAAPVQTPKPVNTPQLPPAGVAQVIQGPAGEVAPKTIAGSVLTAFKGGYGGIDARINELESIKMRALMTPEASRRLQTEIDVLTAMKGGAGEVSTAYDAQMKLMMVSRFTPEGMKAATEKLDALKAGKDAFAVVSKAADDLTKAMQVSRYTKEGYQVALAQLSALRSFAGGLSAIEAREKAIAATPATNADEKAAFALEKNGLAAVRDGADGVRDSLMSVLIELSRGHTWPEAAQQQSLYAALDATFKQIPTAVEVAKPVEPVEPQKTIATDVVAAFRGGFKGVDAKLKELMDFMSRARLTPEAAAKLNATVAVLEAIQGGADKVKKALDAQTQLVTSWGSVDPLPAAETEKLAALTAANNAFSVFAKEADALESTMMRAMLTPEASRRMRTQIEAYRAFAEGPAALETGVSQQWLEIPRTPELQHVSTLLGDACAALLGGQQGIAEAKASLQHTLIVSRLTQEGMQRMQERIALLDAIAATYAKV